MKEEMGGSLQWGSEVLGRQLWGKEDLLRPTLFEKYYSDI